MKNSRTEKWSREGHEDKRRANPPFAAVAIVARHFSVFPPVKKFISFPA
jgi:hypothetical protein